MPKFEFRTVTFKQIVVDLSDRATVLDAKRQLAGKMGCGPEAVTLIVRGRPLLDRDILSMVCSSRGDKAPVVYRLPWFPVHAPASDEPKKADPANFNSLVDDLLRVGITGDRKTVEAALRTANYDKNAATEILLGGGPPPVVVRPGPEPMGPGSVPKDIRDRLMKAKGPGRTEADAINIYLQSCGGNIELAETILRDE
jgi:hypothetical protein